MYELRLRCDLASMPFYIWLMGNVWELSSWKFMLLVTFLGSNASLLENILGDFNLGTVADCPSLWILIVE